MSAIAGLWGQDYTQLDDKALLARIRGGDTEAYAELWRRHLPSAYRTAHRHRGRTSADDIVGEASVRVYDLLQSGRGPTDNFGAYFRQAVRTVAVDAARTELRVVPSEPEVLEAASSTVPAHDVTGRVDRELACAAFRRLSEREQQLLLRTAVEGQPPAVAATALGMTPNGVSVAASRARETLRARYLDAHADRGVARAQDEECRWVLSRMGRYVRGKLPVRQRLKVQRHLAGCRHAQVLMLEMSEVNRGLSALVVPLVAVAASSSGLLAAGAGGLAGALGGLTAGNGAGLANGGAVASSGAPGLLGHGVTGSVGALTSAEATAVASAGATSAAGVAGASGALAVSGAAGAVGAAGTAGAVGGTAGAVSAVVGHSAAAGIAAKAAALATVGTLAAPIVTGVHVDVLDRPARSVGQAVAAQAPAVAGKEAGSSTTTSSAPGQARDDAAAASPGAAVLGSVPLAAKQPSSEAAIGSAPAKAASSSDGSAGASAQSPVAGGPGAQHPGGQAAAQGSGGAAGAQGSGGGSGAQIPAGAGAAAQRQGGEAARSQAGGGTLGSRSGGTGSSAAPTPLAAPASPFVKRDERPKASNSSKPAPVPAAAPDTGSASPSPAAAEPVAGKPSNQPAASDDVKADGPKADGAKRERERERRKDARRARNNSVLVLAQKACPQGWQLVRLSRPTAKGQTFLVCLEARSE